MLWIEAICPGGGRAPLVLFRIRKMDGWRYKDMIVHSPWTSSVKTAGTRPRTIHHKNKSINLALVTIFSCTAVPMHMQHANTHNRSSQPGLTVTKISKTRSHQRRNYMLTLYVSTPLCIPHTTLPRISRLRRRRPIPLPTLLPTLRWHLSHLHASPTVTPMLPLPALWRLHALGAAPPAPSKAGHEAGQDDDDDETAHPGGDTNHDV